MERFDYTVTSGKAFQEVLEAVQAKIAEKGFRVQGIHDIQATLASKGFNYGPMVIIETCNAGFASQVLNKDPMISLMMPCKINVWVQEGKTVISTLRPVALTQFFPEARLEAISREVDSVLTSIVNEVK